MERRFIASPGKAAAGKLQTRAASGSSPGKVIGLAAAFDSETVIAGQFREVIRPGAFTESLNTADVRALFNHNSGALLGRQSAGNLNVWESSRGLEFELALPNTTLGRDTWELVRSGNLTGMSFGFAVQSERWSDQRTALPLRELLAVDLMEISIVTWPAYDATSVSVERQACRILHAHRQQALRDKVKQYEIRARVVTSPRLALECERQAAAIYKQTILEGERF